MAKVSIVIPVYNAKEGLLDRTLHGIFNQTEPDFEVLLINDGSTNGCVSKINANYLNDLRLRIINQKNMGIEGAIDTGIRKASGKYFYCIGQDDYMHPQTLEYCIYVLNQHDADFCIFYWHKMSNTSIPNCERLIDFNDVPVTEHSLSDIRNNPKSYAQSLHGLNMDAWGHFAKTSLVKSIHSIWPLYESTTRTNLMQRHARKWLICSTRLYYYYTGEGLSLSKRPITATYINRNRHDFEALCDLYEKEKECIESRVVWDAVRDNFIVKGVKIVINWYRRHNKECDSKLNHDCLDALSHMLWSLHLREALPLRKINLRLYLIYWWIMLRYGDKLYRTLPAHHGRVEPINHELYLSNNCCVLESKEG